MAAGSIIPVIPWIAWNIREFGTVTQDSMVANKLFFGQLHDMSHSLQHYGSMLWATLLGVYPLTEWPVLRFGWDWAYVRGSLHADGLRSRVLLRTALRRPRRRIYSKAAVCICGAYAILHFAFLPRLPTPPDMVLRWPHRLPLRDGLCVGWTTSALARSFRTCDTGFPCCCEFSCILQHHDSASSDSRFEMESR